MNLAALDLSPIAHANDLELAPEALRDANHGIGQECPRQTVPGPLLAGRAGAVQRHYAVVHPHLDTGLKRLLQPAPRPFDRHRTAVDRDRRLLR